ncbi:MAG: hypothetical protein ACYTFT_15525, partial [Planctomycetota bacterium]
HETIRLESELPAPDATTPVADSADPLILGLLEHGRASHTDFDLQTSPLAAFLYRDLGDAGTEAMIEGHETTPDPKAWLQRLPSALLSAVARATANVALSRREALLALADD